MRLINADKINFYKANLRRGGLPTHCQGGGGHV